MSKETKALNIERDPLARAIAKARKGNPVDELGKLLDKESHWRRKHTIARNKLAEVQEQIRDLAMGLAVSATKEDKLP